MWTARPRMSPASSSTSPVWMPARTAMPMSAAARTIPAAARTARSEPSKRARTPSPVELVLQPLVVEVDELLPAGRPEAFGGGRRVDHIREEDRAEHSPRPFVDPTEGAHPGE